MYAANTTQIMLDDKAYYRAVRGRQLTYESLWHLKWPMFKPWPAEHGHEHDVAVEVFAQIDQLSDALRSEEVETPHGGV